MATIHTILDTQATTQDFTQAITTHTTLLSHHTIVLTIAPTTVQAMAEVTA